MQTISLKLPDDLLAQLESEAKARSVTKSWLVRESLEKALRSRSPAGAVSCYDLARDLPVPQKDSLLDTGPLVDSTTRRRRAFMSAGWTSTFSRTRSSNNSTTHIIYRRRCLAVIGRDRHTRPEYAEWGLT